MTEPAGDRISAITFMIAGIFSSQQALKILAPEFGWSGLGNLLGDFGELVALERYGLTKAPRGARGYDAIDDQQRTVQIKTNRAASSIGFRGDPDPDLLLVIKVGDAGDWREMYFGDFGPVRQLARYSPRDNKYMVTPKQLEVLVQQGPAAASAVPPPGPSASDEGP